MRKRSTFDILVSECFASLKDFREGSPFITISGGTFKGYSTLAEAEAAMGKRKKRDKAQGRATAAKKTEKREKKKAHGGKGAR